MSKRATKVKLRLRMTGTIESDDGNEYRWQKMDREPTVSEVVEWLREQGAINYAAAVRRGIQVTGDIDGISMGDWRSIVDAALRPPVSSSQEVGDT